MPRRSAALQLGLVVVADAAFGHQPRGFVGEAVAAFAGAGLGVLAGVVHGASPVDPGRLYRIGRASASRRP